MTVYHVVTDRPMHTGQEIIFDENHHSGVYERVMAKRDAVERIYADPDKYRGVEFDHHTAVALRELALEEVRREKYQNYPSRMGCLYVSKTLREAEGWGKYFARIGRPTYCIARLEVEGNCFIGDAAKCFDGTADREDNLRLAEFYWKNEPSGEPTIDEFLVDGRILVAEIVKEINANIE